MILRNNKGFKETNKFSSKRDLQDINWIRFDENGLSEKTLYRFQPKGKLIISSSGDVTNGTWDLLDDNTLLIEIPEKKSELFRLFKHLDGLIFLQKDGTNLVYSLISESEIEKVGQNVIKYLESLEVSKIEDEKEFQTESNIREERITDIETNSSNRNQESKPKSNTGKDLLTIGFILVCVVIIYFENNPLDSRSTSSDSQLEYKCKSFNYFGCTFILDQSRLSMDKDGDLVQSISFNRNGTYESRIMRNNEIFSFVENWSYSDIPRENSIRCNSLGRFWISDDCELRFNDQYFKRE